MLKIDVLITLLVFVPLIGVVATVQIMSERLEKYRRASRKATGRVTSAIGEIFGSVQAIQVAAAEPYVLTHFQTLNEKRRVAMLRDAVLTQMLNSTFANTVGLGTGFILILAAQACLRYRVHAIFRRLSRALQADKGSLSTYGQVATGRTSSAACGAQALVP